jgi:N-acetylglucosamine kinase-like BadF-type ATPase
VTYFLGVDGGQSGTTALIGDDHGTILGTGNAGPCNHAGAEDGRAKLENAVTQSVAAACRQAGLDADKVEFEAACFGMSGGPEDKQAILASILQVRLLTVTTDAVIALAGATGKGQGIITIAGTGSIAFGRNSVGHSARAGGWGYVFGDEGGAFDIVRQALRAALRMEEGWGANTVLRAVLLEATESGNANQALHRMYTADWPRHRVAALAPLVDAAATDGDGTANEILAGAAMQLAMLAASVRTQLWKAGEPVTVAYIGGVFASQLLLERFRLLTEMHEGVQCIAPHHGPAEGALLEAYRTAQLLVSLHKP